MFLMKIFLIKQIDNVLKKCSGAQPGIFRDRGGFLERELFDGRFMCGTQKKSPGGKNVRCS